MSSLSFSACAAADQACLCADQQYSNMVESCVLSNCQVTEALIVKNATWSGCGFPVHNRDSSLTATIIVLSVIPSLLFILRMLSRAVKIAPWGWDDSTIVVAYVSRPRHSSLDRTPPLLTCWFRILGPLHVVLLCRRGGRCKQYGPG